MGRIAGAWDFGGRGSDAETPQQEPGASDGASPQDIGLAKQESEGPVRPLDHEGDPEERALCAELPGYSAYAERVRYRLIPRVW